MCDRSYIFGKYNYFDKKTNPNPTIFLWALISNINEILIILIMILIILINKYF